MKSKNVLVYVVGAGPGDPGLLTVKGASVIKQADVILYDRLVNEALLEYASPNAELVAVGKQGGVGGTAQANINELIIQYAQAGNIVVRLKGGDVSFFANLLDELEALRQHNIQYEIVPGVTAASGCAAYSGIPLTARGYSDQVHILALHNIDKIDESDWRSIAGLKGTIVLYMSSLNIKSICHQLKLAGMENRKFVVVEQGTTAYQQKLFSSIHQVDEDFIDKDFKSPSLIIIGSVVELAEKFSWYDSSANGLLFKKLTEV